MPTHDRPTPSLTLASRLPNPSERNTFRSPGAIAALVFDYNGPMRRWRGMLAWMAAGAMTAPASAVLVAEAPGRRTEPPSAARYGNERGGWDYVGEWGRFTGVAIGPRHFLTAKHVGGKVGQEFRFRGNVYTAVESTPVGDADLRLWKVDRDLPAWAPLARRALEPGARAIVVGRGRAPGKPVLRDGKPIGWAWGADDGAMSWGMAPLQGVRSSEKGQSLWTFAFDHDGAGLAAGDSGGGVFVRERGRWALAGICHATQGIFRIEGDTGKSFGACLFDTTGYAIRKDSGPIVDTGSPVPSLWFASRVDVHAGELAATAVPLPWQISPPILTVMGGAGILIGGYYGAKRRRGRQNRP